MRPLSPLEDAALTVVMIVAGSTLGALLGALLGRAVIFVAGRLP